MVMVALLPSTACSSCCLIDGPGAQRFGAAHQLIKRALLKRYQPMKVIRHYYPCQRFGKTLFLCLFELLDNLSPNTPIQKNGLPIQSVGGQEIDAILLALPATAQAMGSWK